MTATGASPWATRVLGVRLTQTRSSAGHPLSELIEPGLRCNPRRAHLLVSTVLGKHIPTSPVAVLGAGDELGALVASVLGYSASRAVVLGFAETATGLGQCVATHIGAWCYLHSTRRTVEGADVLVRFEEGHSHATSHMLQPSNAELLDNDRPLVLVDDEISTGGTAIDAIRALHHRSPRSRYVIASLVDLCSNARRTAVQTVATELKTRIDAVSLATGRIELPNDLIDAVRELPDSQFNPSARRPGAATRVELPWRTSTPDGGRHGFLASDAEPFETASQIAAGAITPHLDPARPVIVVGHEELMYLPLRIADMLTVHHRAVRFQSTTRSPAYVLDDPGYPLRRGFRFDAPELGEAAPRHLYNAQWPGSERPAQIVTVIDGPADTRRLVGDGGLVDVLTAAGHDVLVAVVPGATPQTLRAVRLGLL
ncbi:MAG: hypothetical protein JWQ86_1974 [Mycobacterium sp.]|nr:hypothetical protein [Mycobacterium sp.]